MIHRKKALGVALAAVLALSALAAQVAAADPLTVEGGGTVFYTGDQDGGLWKFDSSSGASQCPTTSIKASSSGTTVNETSYEATYSNCSAFGFVTMHWSQSGCTYKFTTPTKIKAGEVTWHASDIHIVCSAGKNIEYTPTSFGVSVCTRFIGSQTPTGGHVVGTNVTGGGKTDVTLDITLTGMHYTGTGGPCGNSETHSDLTWTGNSTVRAYSNGGHTTQVGIAYS